MSELIVIDIGEHIFLENFEEFQQVLIPDINTLRYAKGLDKLTEDEQVNLFLDLRKKYGIK